MTTLPRVRVTPRGSRSQVYFRVCEKVHNISWFGCLSMLVPSTIPAERVWPNSNHARAYISQCDAVKL